MMPSELFAWMRTDWPEAILQRANARSWPCSSKIWPWPTPGGHWPCDRGVQRCASPLLRPVGTESRAGRMRHPEPRKASFGKRLDAADNALKNDPDDLEARVSRIRHSATAPEIPLEAEKGGEGGRREAPRRLGDAEVSWPRCGAADGSHTAAAADLHRCRPTVPGIGRSPPPAGPNCTGGGLTD